MAAVVATPAGWISPRQASRRTFAMCPPRFFGVTYSINPWMRPSCGSPASPSLATVQWHAVKAVYESAGHAVEVIPPTPGQPDMVFAANAGTVIGGRALVSRFRHAERGGEEHGFLRWFEDAGLDAVRQARHINEGEGDFVVVGDVVLAGFGFRTEATAHREAERFFGVPVVSLELVDPRYYHLDMALCALDGETIAYNPEALAPSSRRTLEALFPDAILADPEAAAALAINAASDGLHVVLADGAPEFCARLRERGFIPITVDVSELAKAGGAVKCCTLEIRR